MKLPVAARRLRAVVLTAVVLAAALAISLVLQRLMRADAAIPMLFVLAVFLIALGTDGYAYGVVASLLSVLAVNFAFTAPYFTLSLTLPENIVGALVMLVVTVSTSTLTVTRRRQEQIRSETARETMRANLLRAISHDLRTPLTTIYGSCSAIIENYDRLPKAQQIKLLGEVREEAEWLIRMVENLLSVTRIDGGRVQIVKTPTVLEELIDSVLIKFRKRYPGQAVAVTIPDEFVSIPMDAVLIEQVLINLLENAVQHAAGMQKLELKVRCEGDRAVFAVEDDGCGIPREKIGELFNGRMDGADGHKNMGIGLSVCATIIKAHGGAITAENRPGGGAAFRFWLSLEEEDAPDN
ncbi:MAG TPA: PAS domain-containing sensor histidine kinase [Candidatus Gemmiger avicola]|uniref:histidine kinase n=1 Tax=Candidatus Gemmiger avicola TaxID=2838605 RepID=A0A9D2M8X0_9FIRM|nr:PAS domain-containing sensor histidine kinase [Candidatus Gemmiger avicola]